MFPQRKCRRVLASGNARRRELPECPDKPTVEPCQPRRVGSRHAHAGHFLIHRFQSLSEQRNAAWLAQHPVKTRLSCGHSRNRSSALMSNEATPPDAGHRGGRSATARGRFESNEGTAYSSPCKRGNAVSRNSDDDWMACPLAESEVAEASHARVEVVTRRGYTKGTMSYNLTLHVRLPRLHRVRSARRPSPTRASSSGAIRVSRSEHESAFD